MPQPTLPTIPTIPLRTQAPATFSANVDGFLTFIPAAITFMDEAGTWCDSRATSATASESAASISAASAASSASAATAGANYIGDWTGLTGAYSLGVSVSHKGAFWKLNADTASIQSIEPSVSGSWTFSSGTRWTSLITIAQSVPANSMNNVKAFGSMIDITMPAFAVGDFLVIHCTADSDNLTRLLNPSHAIRGSRNTIVAGDHLTLKAGDTVHLVYVDTNILEII